METVALPCRKDRRQLKPVSPLQQALRSFKVTMSVDPKFHPKIIGRKGAVISQIRKEHDVSIQFPDKGDEEQVSGCRCDQDTSRAGDPGQVSGDKRPSHWSQASHL